MVAVVLYALEHGSHWTMVRRTGVAEFIGAFLRTAVDEFTGTTLMVCHLCYVLHGMS